MRPKLILLIGLLAVASISPLLAQTGTDQDDWFQIVSKVPKTESVNGVPVKRVYLSIALTPKTKDKMKDGAEYSVVVEEEKGGLFKEVARKLLSKVTKQSRELSMVLAVDTSGSMTELTKTSTRMEQARKATGVFFKNLPAKVEAGLVLFNHEIYQTLDLTLNRSQLTAQINAATPGGGTAYMDACLRAIDMLATVKNKDKALIVMTDGVDHNSRTRDLNIVIKNAKDAGVKVFPIGIGEPGKKEKVTSVLALDMSGSMNSPVSAASSNSKLKSLMTSANRFIQIMPDNDLVRSMVLLFSNAINYPGTAASYEFTRDKKQLGDVIGKLLPPEDKKMGISGADKIEAQGETALLDATFDAICLLEAENPPGKKVVVGLTDGIDNVSRHRVEEIIERANKSGIQLFMLGFGQPGELDDAIMKKMTSATKGNYFEASNEKDLVAIFEKLSVQIHDDGVDAEALGKLATQTGGKYYPADDVDKLQFILEQVTQSLSVESFDVNFDSLTQQEDGVFHAIRLKLVRSEGTGSAEQEVGTKETAILGRGLIMAQMSPLVYLSLLAGLGVLLALPVGLKKLMGGART